MKKNVVAIINCFNNNDEMRENYYNKRKNYNLHILIRVLRIKM